MYISPNEKAVEALVTKRYDTFSIYKYLKGFIEDKENWEQEKVQKIDVQKEINQEKGFINILGKDDDELSYSN